MGNTLNSDLMLFEGAHEDLEIKGFTRGFN